MFGAYRSVRTGAALVALTIIVAACGGSNGAAGDAEPAGSTLSAVAGSPTSVGASASAPSQSAADAARDAVVPALAAMPFDVRVSIVAEAAAAEGVWVLSHPTKAATPGSGCRIGPDAGSYPTDWICATEYGELLLLDAGRTTIVRAYPLPGVAPDLLKLTDRAVYCGRGPDAATLTPDAMVCRVDRSTLGATVRVFPAAADSVVVQPCFTVPAGWSVAAKGLDVADLRATDTSVEVVSAGGAVTGLDPVTLAERGAIRAVTARSNRVAGTCPAPSTTAR